MAALVVVPGLVDERDEDIARLDVLNILEAVQQYPHHRQRVCAGGVGGRPGGGGGTEGRWRAEKRNPDKARRHRRVSTGPIFP
jgi:hypothetical protein